MERALPPAFPHRPRRGAAELRRAARRSREQLGYATRAGLIGVERFMKHYFLIAKDVGDLTAIVCAALEERQTKPHAGFDRFCRHAAPADEARSPRPRTFASTSTASTSAATDVFEQRSGQSDPAVLGRRPHRICRSIPTRCGSSPNRCSASTPACATTRRPTGCSSRSSPRAIAPEVALRLMNEAGVLGRFIPDFGRIVAMMQFNMYHHYTVDEHLLRARRRARRHRGRAARGRICRWPTKIMPSDRAAHARSMSRLFLHDIAKGRGEDHSIAGAAGRAQALPAASGSAPAETETRRLADRESSRHVQHRRRAAISPTRAPSRPSPRSCRPSSG